MAIRAADYMLGCAGKHETRTFIAVAEGFSALATVLRRYGIGCVWGAKWTLSRGNRLPYCCDGTAILCGSRLGAFELSL